MSNCAVIETKPPVVSTKKRVFKILFMSLFYLACLVVVFWMVLPFLWSLSGSLRMEEEISGTTVISFFPKTFTMSNYSTAITEAPFFRMLANSLISTIAGLLTNLSFGSLAAYAFAKIKMKGHKLIFNILMISMMLPGVVTLVPTFMVIVKFPLLGGNDISGSGGMGLYNSLWAVILPGSIGVYGIFFMRQFFVTLPDDLAESARIDGAGELRIFFSIYLPLVLPGLMTLGIFTFQGGWNNFMWPSIVLFDTDKWLLTQAFSIFKSTTTIKYGPLMALSMLMALPVILLFIGAQKYFIKGVAIGGVKG